MAFDLNSLRSGKQKSPYRVMFYGPPGIGKSTWAAMPDTLMINIEDGLDHIDCVSTPKMESYEQVLDVLDAVIQQDHQFKRIAIDSVDWLEKLIFDYVVRKANKETIKNIEDFGYGKGYTFAQAEWRDLVARLEWIRLNKGISIIMLAHSLVKTMYMPDLEPFDKYVVRMHQKSQDILVDWVDVVLFANYFVSVDGEKKKAKGSGERRVYTSPRPAYLAKNRAGLPETIPFQLNAELAPLQVFENLYYSVEA